MTDEEKFTELEWHRKMAAQLFNHTWGLIDKGDSRTKDEADEMIHSAHASRYHWTVVVNSGKYPKTGPTNLQTGDWQMSRVYSLLKKPEPAIYYAKRAIEICETNNIGDYNLAWAYEAMARALSIVGDREADVIEFLAKAKDAGEAITNEENRKLFFSELGNIPGYE
ncbi:MAG: hypothetical protein ACE5OZ_05675 [Candidatus Heimdallarchaeota archaeon]